MLQVTFIRKISGNHILAISSFNGSLALYFSYKYTFFRGEPDSYTVYIMQDVTEKLGIYLVNYFRSYTEYGNLWTSEAYSKLCQTSKIQLFAKIVDAYQPLTIFAKTLHKT